MATKRPIKTRRAESNNQNRARYGAVGLAVAIVFFAGLQYSISTAFAEMLFPGVPKFTIVKLPTHAGSFLESATSSVVDASMRTIPSRTISYSYETGCKN